MKKLTITKEAMLKHQLDKANEKLEHCYDLLDNDKNYMYCDNCEKHYDTLEFDWIGDTPVCKCGNKINL